DQFAHGSPAVVIGVGAGPEHDLRAADRDRVAVDQGGGVDAVTLDVTAVRRAEIGGDDACRGHLDLEVPPRDAGVVDDDVGLAAAADDGHRAGQQVALAVDVDDRMPGGRLGGRGRRHGSAAGGGADGEAAGRQGLVLDEVDLDRPDEGVALGGGMLGGDLYHLVRESVGAEVDDLLVVGVRQLDGELVGHDRTSPGDGGGAIVHLTADG